VASYEHDAFFLFFFIFKNILVAFDEKNTHKYWDDRAMNATQLSYV